MDAPVDDRRNAIALFRYSLIREAADPALSPRQRGALVRALAERDHVGPDGQRVRLARGTLDRWIRDWRQGGFAALLPRRHTQGLRTAEVLLNLAVELKQEAPRRTATQIAAIIAESRGDAPSARTISRYFGRIGLARKLADRPARAFGRFEAERPNDLWTGDALHGPTVAGRKTYLFCFIDDHSRALVGYRSRPWRGHPQVGGGAAGRAGLPWRAQAAGRRQRLGVRQQAARAGLRDPGHPPGPQPPRRTGRAGQDRAGVRHRAPPVPRGARRPRRRA